MTLFHEVFGIVDIAVDLRDKAVEIGILFFIAQLVQKVHPYAATVNVGSKIEQMYFEHGYGVGAFDSRAPAQACHAGQGSAVEAAEFDGEDPHERRAVVLELNVRCGKADVASQLVAVHHASRDAIGPPEQARG